MICSKCGITLDNGAKFCPQCGAKLFANGQLTQNEILQNKAMSKRRTVQYDYELGNSVLRAGTDRIENVDDPEINRKLFTVYAKLVHPMQELEKANNQYLNNEQRIGALQKKISIVGSIQILTFIQVTIIAFIIDFIVGAILANIFYHILDLKLLSELVVYQAFVLPFIIGAFLASFNL
ncbi:MAG: zinc ribbon domain-containing protein [Lachnospiraceae bacterium]|nr:zinc ribbon domain-containing protein [Lachnospiraceae bacterium]